MLATSDAPQSRRERTFAGIACVVCDEPLEHTLKGERVLQLSCAHVTHEACFYEYIKEFDAQSCPGCEAPLGLHSGRGGNVLDIGKEQESFESSEGQERDREHGESHGAAMEGTVAARAQGGPAQIPSHQPQHRAMPSQQQRVDQVRQPTRSPRQGHAPQISSTSSTPPVPAFLSSPIPPPIISLRSEYPSIQRSTKQQNLTCLVTVEVPQQKWLAHAQQLHLLPSTEPEVPAPADSAIGSTAGDSEGKPQVLSADAAAATAEALRSCVDNWHGLDFSK
ncbi:hypothetical protein MRB53_038184 [Persea americana]|nr:hypothetical protein MRB53_038184 [Persea americana]